MFVLAQTASSTATSTATSAPVPATPSPPWVQVVGDVAWPIVAVVALLVIAFRRPLRDWLVDQSRRIAKVSAFGVDLELTQEGAREVKEATESTFGELRKHIITEFDRLVRAGRIDEKLERLIENDLKPVLENHGVTPLDFRCTIHVSDVLYTETLYQLLDYYPHGGGRGRTLSIRLGIVGKAWRLQSDQIEPVISSKPDKLIEEWGMTLKEASGGGVGESRRSFAAIPLKDSDETELAVVYFDSPKDNAFGASEARKSDISRAIHMGAERLGLTRALAEIVKNMESRGPHIPLYRIGTPS
jgi:hypothetical protein